MFWQSQSQSDYFTSIVRITWSRGSVGQTTLGQLDIPVVLEVLLSDRPPVPTVNALIPLQSSLALVELDQDRGVSNVDENVHGDGENDEGQDEIDRRGVTQNALDVTSEPLVYNQENDQQSKPHFTCRI